jgi:hypothetical protein
MRIHLHHMSDPPDLTALLRALADAEAAVPPEIATRLPPDLRSKYDLLRKDLNHMSMRVQALRQKIAPVQQGG